MIKMVTKTRMRQFVKVTMKDIVRRHKDIVAINSEFLDGYGDPFVPEVLCFNRDGSSTVTSPVFQKISLKFKLKK